MDFRDFQEQEKELPWPSNTWKNLDGLVGFDLKNKF